MNQSSKMSVWGAAIASGSLLALMLAANSSLAKFSSVTFASWYAHGTGFLVSLLCLILLKRTPIKYQAPIWSYLGGVPGALTVVFASIAINSQLLLSASVTLMLLGQVVFSSIIDHYGCLGVSKRQISKCDIYAMALIVLGALFILVGRG